MLEILFLYINIYTVTNIHSHTNCTSSTLGIFFSFFSCCFLVMVGGEFVLYSTKFPWSIRRSSVDGRLAAK
jgi:hypothetical protein